MDTSCPELRILVVDDNDILRKLLAHALESAGYVVSTAESAEAALEVLRFHPPDLCVIDQVMPGMSGSELIRTLRRSADARLRALPVLALTGLPAAEEEMLAAGAQGAIQKPLREDLLLDGVRHALGGPGGPTPAPGVGLGLS
jgi:two-component system phosphate regulon response regulator PhoB